MVRLTSWRAPSRAFDVAAIRSHFPALQNGAAHFDGPGGTQTPAVVARAVYDTLTGPLANRGSNSLAERNAEAAVVGCRAAVGDLLGVDPTGVIFGRSMSQNTFDMARTMAKRWGPGDEVVVSRLDHESNVRSWASAAERVGATVRVADFDPETGEEKWVEDTVLVYQTNTVQEIFLELIDGHGAHHTANKLPPFGTWSRRIAERRVTENQD